MTWKRNFFRLRLQIEHLNSEVFVNQQTYIAKVLKCFYVEKYHPLYIPMVMRSLDLDKDHFKPQEEDE